MLRSGSINGNGVRKRQRLTGTAKRQRKNGNGMVETGHNDVKLVQLNKTVVVGLFLVKMPHTLHFVT